MSRHHQKPQTMSRDAAGWKLSHIIGSAGAAIVMCGTLTLAIVPAVYSAPAAASAAGVTVTPAENNWG